MFKRIRIRLYTDNRLDIGAAVLAAVAAVKISAVKQRVAPFADANDSYEATLSAAEKVEAQLQAYQDGLNDLDGKQDAALEEVACVLVGEQRTRRNPFAALGFDAPSRLKLLKYGEKAQAIHQLTAAIRKVAARESASYRSAAAADKAACAMETALQPVHMLQATVTTARHARDVAGKRWDAELAALKCAARAAAPDGSVTKAVFGDVLIKSKPPGNVKPVPVVDTPPADTPPVAAAADTPSATPAETPVAGLPGTTETPAGKPA